MSQKTTTYTALLQGYTQAYNALQACTTGPYSRERYALTDNYNAALQTLATAAAYSVLKKCIDVSYNATLIDLRSGIAKSQSLLRKIAYCIEHENDFDGRAVIDLEKSLNKLLGNTLCDSMDLVQTASTQILDEVRKQAEKGDPIDLERPYMIRRLKSHVWIKVEDSVKGWETVQTTPIQEIHKAVRREIARNGSVKVAIGEYTYIDDIAVDPETEMEEVIYRRFGKACDIGGYVTTMAGNDTLYTASRDIIAMYDYGIDKLQLSKQQATIYRLRYAGKGYKAIATYLGVSDRNVVTQCNRMSEKVKKYDPALYDLAVAKGYVTHHLTDAEKEALAKAKEKAKKEEQKK